MRGSRVLPAVLVLGLAACRGADYAAEPQGVTVRDSAGVTIVENGTLDLVETVLAMPAPTLQIGVVEGSDEYQLFRVADIGGRSSGRQPPGPAGASRQTVRNHINMDPY